MPPQKAFLPTKSSKRLARTSIAMCEVLPLRDKASTKSKKVHVAAQAQFKGKRWYKKFRSGAAYSQRWAAAVGSHRTKLPPHKVSYHQVEIIQLSHNYHHLNIAIMMDVLLMGDAKAGRSSIAKVIFQKMVSKSTKLLGETSKMESYDFKVQKIEFKLYDFPAKYDVTEPPPNEQMILKNASALIYVLSASSDLTKAGDAFHKIYKYLKAKNTNNCSMFIFVNKADIELTLPESRSQYLIKLKKKIGEDDVDVREIQFFFTSINDSSIFQAFSRVLQRLIPCSPNVCQLLNHFANCCKVEKVYLFDLVTKLYIAHNDEKIWDPLKYDICSDMLDVFIDISYLYDKDRHQDDHHSTTNVKLAYEEENEYFALRVMEKYLALVFIIKEANFDRPYLVEENVEVFRRGLGELLNATTSMLK